MRAIFGGGGGGGGSRPQPQPQPQPARATGTTSAERARNRRIGRAALIVSDQENLLAATTGRNVLTAV